jgi:hypothetical protein
MYSVTFEEVAVTAVQDLFEINAPADSAVRVHGLVIAQSSDTDSEQLNILVHRGSTSGSGGSTPTPNPLELGNTAFGGTVEANNTTQSTEGVFLHSDAFNVLNGYSWIPTPELQWEISPSGRLIIELQTAPGDELTMSATVYLEEIGG